MPSSRGSFFSDWRAREIENSTSRSLTITPSFSTSANAQYQDTLRIDITSNLPAVTIPYYLSNLTDDYFLSGTANGNITIDSNGNANISFQIDPFYDVSNAYVTLTTQFQLSNDYPNSVIGSSPNIEIAKANTFDASGWEESNISASLDGLQGGYKLHTLVGLTQDQIGPYSNTVVANLTVNSLGDDPANADIDILIVGAGAQGGGGGWTKSQTSSPTLIWIESFAGAGGAGGEVVPLTLKANVFTANTSYTGSVANASLAVDSFGSNVYEPVSGGNTSFLGYTALGGGHGAGMSKYMITGPSRQYYNAEDGGSGGGGSPGNVFTWNGNAGTSLANVTYGYGKDGGTGAYKWYGAFGTTLTTYTQLTLGLSGIYRYKHIGGGGGGATEAGSNSSMSVTFPTVSGTAGDGGEGYSSNISGSTVIYGSGGGAGGLATSVTYGLGGTNAGNGGWWNESNSGGESTHLEPRGGYATIHTGAGGGGGGAPDEDPLNYTSVAGLAIVGGRGSDGILMVRYLSQVRTIKLA